MSFFDTLPIHLQETIMDMKNNIEIQEELIELKQTPSHQDLPFINEYPLINCKSRICVDIRYVNFMKKHGSYGEIDFINVFQCMLKIKVPTPNQSRSILKHYEDHIILYLKTDLGIVDEFEQQVIMYRLLNKVRNTRVALLTEYHFIHRSYTKLFDEESKKINQSLLRFGEPITKKMRFQDALHINSPADCFVLD